MDDEQRAYRRAYDLLEGVQAEDPRGALAEVVHAQQVARRHAWNRVDLVLQLVAVVHDLVHGPDARTDARVEDLMAQSRRTSQLALVACALGVRGVLRNLHGDTRQMLEDAANAMVILDDEELPAQDRATGYTIIAAAYNSLRLWELTDELYELATQAGRRDPKPVMQAALAVNPVLIRVEWALALVEVGDDVEATRQLERAHAALALARDTPMPALWSQVRESCACVIGLLTGVDVPDDDVVVSNIEALRRDGDTQMLPMVEAAWVLARYRRAGHRREVRDARLAARDLLTPTGTIAPSSSSSTFPAWVRAQVLAGSTSSPLRLPVRPQQTRALQAQSDHAKLVVRSSWESRRAVLAAAYAQIRVARGRTERERLVHAASTDPLTGLSNRRVFDDWLSGVDTVGSPSGLLLVDVDDFKGVNDTYGHAIGDDVLRALAGVLRECEEAGDVSVRLGGDEFAVLVPRMAHPAALEERARRIGDRVQGYPWSTLAVGVQVRVSSGWSVGGSHEDGETGPGGRLGTYRRADQDLYAGKRGGGLSGGLSSLVR
ncbi:GGDEF domain-containing protein [Angustibacter luteus]|uniref:GGDEF domain-containing protein n=1 Tax=Angustibacter luteus TaxID=658456 RepID=A0ABW1JEF0_9ACTN